MTHPIDADALAIESQAMRAVDNRKSQQRPLALSFFAGKDEARRQILEAIARQPAVALQSVPREQFRHYKGAIYTKLCDGRMSDQSCTYEMVTVYMSETGEFWIRPKEMFDGFNENGERRFVPLPAPLEGET